ncbi:MAG: hypothetical protein ACREHF_00270 [Rhizomicrobium sp.]
MSRKQSTPKVTKTDLDRAAQFIRAMGLNPSAVEVLPGKVRILTGDRALTLPVDSAELDKELAEWDAKHGFD